MDEELIKEQLSFAYFQCICAMNKIIYNKEDNDNDGYDISFRKVINLDESEFNANIYAQVKSTSSPNMYSQDDQNITYRLKAKNYNDLVRRSGNPAILLLYIMPSYKDEWLKWSIEELAMRGQMYWISLKDRELSNNSESVSVTIPKTNIISINSIEGVMTKLVKEFYYE